MLSDIIKQMILKDMVWSPEWDDYNDDDDGGNNNGDNNSDTTTTTTYVHLSNGEVFSFKVAFDNTDYGGDTCLEDKVNLDNDTNAEGDIVYY